MKGLIIRCVGLNEDVREGGGVRGQDERGVQKQAHGEEHDAFAPKAEEEKGERAEQVGPDIEEQGGADGRPEKGNAKKAPVRVLEAMASKRLFPGGAFAPSVAGVISGPCACVAGWRASGPQARPRSCLRRRLWEGCRKNRRARTGRP